MSSTRGLDPKTMKSLDMVEIHPEPMDPGGTPLSAQSQPRHRSRMSPSRLLKRISPSSPSRGRHHNRPSRSSRSSLSSNESLEMKPLHPVNGVSDIHVKNTLPIRNGGPPRPSGPVASPAQSASPRGASPMSSCSQDSLHHENKSVFLAKVQQSGEAIKRGDYALAVDLYTEALALDPKNHILYSNRSAAYIKLGQFQLAVQDACKAKQINPQWTKAYYRQGVALQCLGQHTDGLAAFAAGLVVEPKNQQLLAGLVEAALKSPLKDRFEPVYEQLKMMNLDKSAFVIISVLGQELLSAQFFQASAQLLECALRIGTCSLKLRGSVFSALGSAYWGMGAVDKAIAYMHQDLNVAKSLGDHDGECRGYGNLGAAYFNKGDYKHSLSNHRFQLVLSMRLKLKPIAASALTCLGHVYTAIGDYPNALASHKQCVLLVKQNNQKLLEAREIGNVGAVYLAMGDFDNAVECHNEHLKLARLLKDKKEEARAVSNLGSAHHYKRGFQQAIVFHNQVLAIGVELRDRTLEARAYAGLGHAARCMQDYDKAKYYHEKQLDNALQTKDKVAEGRACSNLGIIYQHMGEFDAALKLHKAHMSLAKDLLDKGSLGRAYGNVGNAHSAVCEFETAIKYHKMELTISKEVNDRHSEASTHGNLAVCYQALKMYDKALHHYHAHLQIAQELKDTSSEARALSNLGNYHSSRQEYHMCIPYYEQYLILSQELHDVVGEGCACHRLGYAHYSLGNIREAIRYYEQDLAIAKDLQDKAALGRAYCNLGLAFKASCNFNGALECQKYFLAITHSMKDIAGKFRALGNMGDVYMKQTNAAEAAKLYNQQLQVAKQCKDRSLQASAYGSLGCAHKLLGQCDKALGFHNQELMLRQELNDARGECRAHANMGNVHMALSNFTNAYKCYHEQLERSKDLMDPSVEAQASGNLAITKMNLGLFEDAVGYFEQQLAILEQCHGPSVLQDRGKALANLGDCYEALADYHEAIRCYEHFLALSLNCNNVVGQERAYRGLGSAHRNLGNLQQALVCFEKRVVVAHELDDAAAKGSAYGELGCLHSILGNFEQAISCLEHQLNVARNMGDVVGEGDAACGLGGVYQQMGEYETALSYHQVDLTIAEKTNNASCQCRAYGNMGLCHESLGSYQQAVMYQEQHLSIAAQMQDRVAKTLAYTSLGRLHHAKGNHQQAIQYLQQGLMIAEQLQRREDEAKIRHRLGLALMANNDLDQAQQHLYKAADLFECIRREAQLSSDYKLSLFDLQTASYQALQRVLVNTGRHEEALVVAERGRTRAFVDLQIEKQAAPASDQQRHLEAPVTIEGVLNTVSRQEAAVLYYSLGAGVVYSWLITPQQGIVKFHETCLADVETSNSDPEDAQSIRSGQSLSSISVLDQYVHTVRESLGVDQNVNKLRYQGNRFQNNGQMSETESEADDLWQQHLDEIGERLNSENDRSGFLRMVNRNHAFNCSNYSLTSLFSTNSALSGLNRTASGMKKFNKNQAPLSALYSLLLAPMDEYLTEFRNSGHRDLILVLQGDLYLIPFSVLKPMQGQCLYERFDTIIAPSLQSIQFRPAKRHCTGALVVGNPKLSSQVIEQWQWYSHPAMDHEAKLVAEMLGVKAWLNSQASKDSIVREMPDCEVIHFAAHISWKLSAIVLASPNASSPNEHSHFTAYELDESSSSLDGPCLSDFLLTAADILNLRLNAKIVVLSSGHSEDRAGRINSDGLVGLTRAVLAAGAQCVLYSLWPVPEQASRLLLKTFYTGLLQGFRAGRALTEAMSTVHNSTQYSHPANWAGWVLVGGDVQLASKMALMGSAFTELLQQYPESKESMRVLLHLVEKSLQRIARGQRNAMYTTQSSIESKMCSESAWKDLLKSVGFRFEPAANNLPPAVFFPTSDPGDRLTQCSNSLQAILGLNGSTVSALVKMLPHTEAGEALIAVVRDVVTRYQPHHQQHHNLAPTQQRDVTDLRLAVRLWRVSGCHEFLASLGFDLVDVGQDEVTLKLGKQANRRMLQSGLTALIAVFDTQEAPRTLSLESSSSMESLNSSHTSGSATSTSNFSKGSSPPGSPRFKKRSLFNPADVQRSAFHRPKPQINPQVGSRRSLNRPKTSPSLQLAHQSAIRAKYGSESQSEGDDLNFHDSADSNSSNDNQYNDRYFPTDSYTEHRYNSTSSEGEEFVPPIARHPLRHSNLSTHSTITLKSTNSVKSAPFKRTSAARASVVSNISTASERTLTNETVGCGSTTDPTKIALRVLAETFPERQALEKLQKDSLITQAVNNELIRAEYNHNNHKTAEVVNSECSKPLTPIQETAKVEVYEELGTDSDGAVAQSTPRGSDHNTPVNIVEKRVSFSDDEPRYENQNVRTCKPPVLPKPKRDVVRISPIISQLDGTSPAGEFKQRSMDSDKSSLESHVIGSDGFTDVRTDTSNEESKRYSDPSMIHRQFDSAGSSECSDDAIHTSSSSTRQRNLIKYKGVLPKGPPPPYKPPEGADPRNRDHFLISKC